MKRMMRRRNTMKILKTKRKEGGVWSSKIRKMRRKALISWKKMERRMMKKKIYPLRDNSTRILLRMEMRKVKEKEKEEVVAIQNALLIGTPICQLNYLQMSQTSSFFSVSCPFQSIYHPPFSSFPRNFMKTLLK